MTIIIIISSIIIIIVIIRSPSGWTSTPSSAR